MLGSRPNLMFRFLVVHETEMGYDSIGEANAALTQRGINGADMRGYRVIKVEVDNAGCTEEAAKRDEQRIAFYKKQGAQEEQQRIMAILGIKGRFD